MKPSTAPRSTVWRAGLLCLALLASACAGATTTESNEAAGGQPSPPGPASANPQGCLSTFDPNVDYFPEKVALTHATNFTVTYHKSYKVITVKEPARGAPPQRYVLFQCGAPKPDLSGELAGATAVKVPVTNVFSGSTTQTPLVLALDRLDKLKAVAKAASISNDAVSSRIKAGQIIEFAPTNQIDVELVVSSAPDVFFSGGTTDPKVLDQLSKAGVPVVAETSWIEPTPLGRAEWMKYIGIYFNAERRATEVFGEIEGRYTSLVKKVASAFSAERPTVMLGFIFQGTFRVPGGNSYQAALIKDAGGTYVWADDTSTSSVTLNVEQQVVRAIDAKFWFSTEINDWKNIGDVVAVDARLANFASVKGGGVWINRLRINPAGGNEFWERAPAYPDLWLADLVKILHPEALPDHKLEWHLKVPAS